MEHLLSLIEEHQKGDPNACIQILKRMDPLLKKYAGKIHCMEYEDAFQELSLTLLETLPYLDIHQSEGKSVKYMETAIVNRYRSLCRQYLSLPQTEAIEDKTDTLADPFQYDESKMDV